MRRSEAKTWYARAATLDPNDGLVRQALAALY
jgi:hypothetical protein